MNDEIHVRFTEAKTAYRYVIRPNGQAEQGHIMRRIFNQITRLFKSMTARIVRR